LQPKILTSNHSALAEGPLWHGEKGLVYWVDILTGTLFWFNPATRQTESRILGGQIGGFTIQENGDLLLFRDRGAIELHDGQEITVLFPEMPEERETRFNDVSADPEGRVFCGTMPTPDRKGRLYRLDPDRSIRIVLEDIGCSNGMGWSPDRQTMYHTDSTEATIYSWDYDRPTGELSNRRVFYHHTSDGVPDGMTVDSYGCVWAAIWGGSCLIHLDPAGMEIERIAMPAKNVTCPTFGGPEYHQLYVTTASGDEENAPDGAGELILLEGAVRGVPEFRSRIG
jgi:sugar lactone lactonase YvrE